MSKVHIRIAIYKATGLCYVLSMKAENILAGTASLFLALGDKTRLRLLNLMRDREICVSSFTGTLGHSQPLISRHLAYLRNSGIVEARRDGKWMHYTISPKLDANTSRLLNELFKWMDTHDGLRVDRDKYREAYPTAAKKDEPKVRKRKATRRPTRQSKVIDHENDEHFVERTDRSEYREHETTGTQFDEPSEEITYSRHNELEDFLL